MSAPRIMIRSWKVPGGESVPFSKFDRALGIDCSFRNASDGALRCLPLGIGHGGHFADARCQQPVWEAPSCAEAQPNHLIRWIAPRVPCFDCGRTEVWERGPAEPRDVVYLRDASGACVRTTVAPAALFWTPLDLVAPETFVEGRRKLDDPTQALTVEWITTEDGGRFDPQAFDTALGTYCGTEGVGEVVCRPKTSFVAGFFSDDGCQDPAALVSAAADPRSLIPGMNGVFYKRGARVDRLFSKVGDACPEFPLTKEWQAFAVGAAVPSEALPRMTVTMTGEGPLRSRAEYAGPMRQGPALFLKDSERQHLWNGDEPCWASKTASGERRCLVERAVSGDEFADSECARLSTPCLDRREQLFALKDPKSGCGHPAGVQSLGATLPTVGGVQPVYVRDAAGKCVFVFNDRVARCAVLQRGGLERFPILGEDLR